MKFFLIMLVSIFLATSACLTNQQVHNKEIVNYHSTPHSLDNLSGNSNESFKQIGKTAKETKLDLEQCISDFKNFTYEWFPSDYSTFVKQKDITLVNGSSPVTETSKKNLMFEANLMNVSCIDITADGEKEAIVTVSVSFSNKARPTRIFVFGSGKEKPKLLWKYDTNAKDRSLRGFYKEGEILVIEEYDDKYGNPTPAACCPQRFFRNYFSWKENNFKKVKVEIIPYEKDYREYIGYPKPEVSNTIK